MVFRSVVENCSHLVSKDVVLNAINYLIVGEYIWIKTLHRKLLLQTTNHSVVRNTGVRKTVTSDKVIIYIFLLLDHIT